MKTTQQTLVTLFFTATVVILASLAYKPAAHSSVINPGADMQAVTVTAQRMTDEQKAAYDREQETREQETMVTMTVTGKAMTAAQKAEFDRTQPGN